MPKDTKTLGNNKARACESLGFAHKKRLCQRFDTTSFLHYFFSTVIKSCFLYIKRAYPLFWNYYCLLFLEDLTSFFRQ